MDLVNFFLSCLFYLFSNCLMKKRNSEISNLFLNRSDAIFFSKEPLVRLPDQKQNTLGIL